MSIMIEQSASRGVDKERLTGVRRLILELAQAQRHTLADLSRGAGKNHSYMHQFLYRGTPAILPEDVRHALAKMLGLPEIRMRQDRSNPDEFAVKTLEREATAPKTEFSSANPLLSAPVAESFSERVPVFLDTDEILPASASEWRQWPGPVAGPITGAFGAYVSRARGRFKPGDLIFVRPRLPPREGDSVIGVRTASIEVIGDLIQLGPEWATIQDGPGAPKAVQLDGLRLLKVTVAHFA